MSSALTIRVTNRFTVWVTPLAPVLIALYAGVGCGVTWVAWELSYLFGVPAHTGWSAIGTVTGLVLAGLLLHEAGHAVAGYCVGHPAYGAKFGLRPGVYLGGDPVRLRRVVISAAGPLAQIAFGVCVGAVVGLPTRAGWADPAGLTSALIVGEGLVNLLVPVSRNCDAVKIYRGIWKTVRSPRATTRADIGAPRH